MPRVRAPGTGRGHLRAFRGGAADFETTWWFAGIASRFGDGKNPFSFAVPSNGDWQMRLREAAYRVCCADADRPPPAAETAIQSGGNSVRRKASIVMKAKQPPARTGRAW